MNVDVLSSSDLLRALRQDQEAPAPTIPSAVHDGYLKAAAVLAAIPDIKSLQPVSNTSPEQVFDAQHVLQNDLMPASSRSFGGSVMLTREARRRALSLFKGHDEIKSAIEANRPKLPTPLQLQFEKYLLADARPLDEQNVEELERTLQISLWTDDLVEGVPARDEVRRRIELQRLLQPLENLAGGDRFRGRVKELDRLRAYVGVVPPHSLLTRLGSALYRWTRPVQRSALNVYGAGGVGKSALISRFVLEHTRVRDDLKVPFAYIDFDRPGLNISDPLGIIVEALRQLSLQFPRAPYDRLRKSGERLLRSSDTERHNNARSLFADVLGAMQADLGPRPYVVVLDTFEEVQYRGESRAFELWKLIAEMQSRWPVLRVVVSGRSPVRRLPLQGAAPDAIELGGLDEESAIAVLTSDGVVDEELAGRLVKQVGGVPLSLKLVGEMVRRQLVTEGGVQDLRTKSRFWISASAEFIQGQLYDRILGHIHDEQVRRLAHPGLVLRTITPEVILHVLNEPCSLCISAPEEAARLFEELERETSLVSFDDSEGALVHRPDLRRLMLGLLREREPVRVAAIHEKAVAYYSDRQDLSSRAELVYHRAALDLPITREDVSDPEVRASLQSSISELPAGVQAKLAALGLQVPPEILNAASDEQRDLAACERVEEMLSYGVSASSELTLQLEKMLPLLNRATPLHRAAARIHAHLRQEENSMRVIEAGLALNIAAGKTLLTTGLLGEKAWAMRASGAELHPVLDALRDYAVREGGAMYILQELLQRHDVAPESQRQCLLGEIASRVVGKGSQAPALDAMQLWSLLPAFEKALEPMARSHQPALQRLAQLIVSESGVFSSTRLPILEDDDSQSVNQRANSGDSSYLSNVIDAAYAVQKFATERECWRLAGALRSLCRAWPYRVLDVRPAYLGHNRSRLARK